MKNVFYFLTALTLLGCTLLTSPSIVKDEQSKADTSAETKLNLSSNSLHHLLTLSDAEKILGEKAHLTDSSTTIKVDTLEYKSAYLANSKDQKSGKTGTIYFLIEQYAYVSSAKKKYYSIKTANENHEGVKVLYDVGDEAYFHSDGENFYFVMVRKGDKVFNMKVNKITSKTSLNAFNLIAKNITAVL